MFIISALCDLTRPRHDRYTSPHAMFDSRSDIDLTKRITRVLHHTSQLWTILVSSYGKKRGSESGLRDLLLFQEKQTNKKLAWLLVNKTMFSRSGLFFTCALSDACCFPRVLSPPSMLWMTWSNHAEMCMYTYSKRERVSDSDTMSIVPSILVMGISHTGISPIKQRASQNRTSFYVRRVVSNVNRSSSRCDEGVNLSSSMNRRTRPTSQWLWHYRSSLVNAAKKIDTFFFFLTEARSNSKFFSSSSSCSRHRRRRFFFVFLHQDQIRAAHACLFCQRKWEHAHLIAVSLVVTDRVTAPCQGIGSRSQTRHRSKAINSIRVREREREKQQF